MNYYREMKEFYNRARAGHEDEMAPFEVGVAVVGVVAVGTVVAFTLLIKKVVTKS